MKHFLYEAIKLHSISLCFFFCFFHFVVFRLAWPFVMGEWEQNDHLWTFFQMKLKTISKTYYFVNDFIQFEVVFCKKYNTKKMRKRNKVPIGNKRKLKTKTGNCSFNLIANYTRTTQWSVLCGLAWRKADNRNDVFPFVWPKQNCD